MILPWMLYGSAIALLLGLASSSFEGVVRQRGWPVRGLWVGALLGSVLLPLLVAVMVPQQEFLVPIAPRSGTGTPALVSPSVPARWQGTAGPTAAGAPLGIDLDAWLFVLWGITSLALTARVVLISRTLLRRTGEWIPHRIVGTDVWISPDTGPAVLGFIRTVIVLPEWLLDRSTEEQELVVAHEREHIRAADPRLLWSSLLVVLAFPWNLPLWWHWRRLREAVEIDCDLRVLARGEDPRAYSRLLVEVCERGAARRFVVAALSGSGSFLERRIRLMLAPTPRHWRTRTAGAALFATACVVAACGLQQPDRTEGGAAANPDSLVAGDPSAQVSAETWDVGPQQVAEFAGRAALERVDPQALAYCHKEVIRAYATHRVSVPDSIDLEVWGRGDTVLIGGAVDWRHNEGKSGRSRWFCDMIREDGKWRQWHVGFGPSQRPEEPGQ